MPFLLPNQCVKALKASNSNRVVYIAPPAVRPRAHRKTIASLFHGVHRQTGTEMFSADDKHWLITAPSATLAACSKLAVRRQRNTGLLVLAVLSTCAQVTLCFGEAGRQLIHTIIKRKLYYGLEIKRISNMCAATAQCQPNMPT